jgi:hypothetical protein
VEQLVELAEVGAALDARGVDDDRGEPLRAAVTGRLGRLVGQLGHDLGAGGGEQVGDLARGRRHPGPDHQHRPVGQRLTGLVAAQLRRRRDRERLGDLLADGVGQDLLHEVGHGGTSRVGGRVRSGVG